MDIGKVPRALAINTHLVITTLTSQLLQDGPGPSANCSIAKQIRSDRNFISTQNLIKNIRRVIIPRGFFVHQIFGLCVILCLKTVVIKAV